MTYWKVKDMTSGNECKDGIGYEGIFYFNKFDSKEEAIEFIKSLPHRTGYIKPYKIFRFDGKKGAGKGWHESPGVDGKAPIHKKVAERVQAKHAQNTPMECNKSSKLTEKRERHIKSLIDNYLEKGYSPGSAKMMAENDYENIFKSEQKPSKLVIQNINSMPIQKESIELIGTTSITSPQNFQPMKQLTLGRTVYFYYDKPFKVVKEKGSIEILPVQNATTTRKEKDGHFIIIEDRMGNITLSHSGSQRVAFFQAEADKEFISDLLKKGEKEDMENGYDVKINDSEPRASTLSELWEASGGG